MKLISLTLCNFRQFYGRTPEIFLSRGSHNTTIIHGNNGSGKTTLMNAFTWVLYEQFSAAFAGPDRLVNKRAITEAKPGEPVACWVQLVFEHDSKRYQAKRLIRAYNTQTGITHGSSELFMTIAGDDGRWSPPPPQQHPDDIIGRILPESLHQYFFFDGERIEYIVRSEKKAEIAEATKKLLGLEVLNRSIRHLGETRKNLETELKAIGDPQTKQLLKEKATREKDGTRLQKRQTEITKELEAQAQLKKTISDRLLELGGAEELQKRRKNLEEQNTSIRNQLKQAKEALKRAISTQGYITLLGEFTSEFRTLVNDLRNRGELPAGIKQPFVQQLLDRQRCICGSELSEGNPARQLVRSWMDKAGMADIEETAIRMSTQVEAIDKQVPDFWQEMDRQQKAIEGFRTELSAIENQLDEIKDKLRSYPDENIQELQKRLDEIERKMSELDRESGSNQTQIDSLQGAIERLNKQLEKQKTNEEKQELAKKRVFATQDAIDRLTEVRSRLENQFRTQLEQRVQEIFSEISFTPYLPKLSDKYELTLIENTSGFELPVAASTGENQILSLSFIGGIIDGVREWSKKNTLMGPDSSTFPIVMDSPFGSLDEIYRRQIAKILPQLANQLVVLVTKTQWRGEVAQEMSPYIGKEYVLVYNSPKPDCEEDWIELKGMRYPLVKLSPNEFEYTEVVEVDEAF
ncbi:AAA family ATPase [Laspinema olomoucense]|uniref:Nuclease SbcCD subunit C n=1 Tax=Laspinema olomoucense D3b TaxID=2953688 RepID=A0ABT2NDB2_9CYAN|nr:MULTISPECIES: AAA family ATPase [unclassified Laspinema]MCT7980677.1 AAA family ATPase [Laspinema sp. D3b]MCT7991226.1 AAA family ATPase [Laspinema sp. D3a]